MSQKKKVRVYQPGGQMGNPMANWFMQMGGVPQQPQQDDMMNQIMVYAQQMIMQGEDPNYVYDDLVTQGVPSQIAAQVVEQIVDSMPPQPSYSQPTTAEAMYNQEVEEEEEEAGPDFMDLVGLYDDEDDDDFEDFKKGGMTKKKFVKEYKKLALGGEKPEEVSKIKSAGFLGAVENTYENAKAEQEAEQMFNNPFAVNALSQFVYGGLLPKAQDAGTVGAFTKEDFDKYVKEQEERYKQQEERYKQLEQRYNQGYMNNPYGYGYGYGPGYGYGRGYGYGNVPTMFNPYGRRGPIFQRTPYFKNFPGANVEGLQLSEFKINPAEQVDRKGIFKFLGPKTVQTWSGTWTKNPVTGKTEPAKPGTTTGTTTTAADEKTSPADAVTAPKTSTSENTTATQTSPGESAQSKISSPSDYGILPPSPTQGFTPEEKLILETPYQDPDDYKLLMKERKQNEWLHENKDVLNNAMNTMSVMRYGGYKFQPGGPTGYEQLLQQNPELTQADIDEYRTYVDKIKQGTADQLDRDRADLFYDNFINPYEQNMNFDSGMDPNEIELPDPNTITGNDEIKNAWTVDIPALYDTGMYYTKGFLNESRNKRDKENYLATFLDNATRGNEQYGFRGNYTTNQLSNSSNFRPNLDGQTQYSQFGGPVVGEELEMTEEEIKKFLKGGGKLRYV